MIRVHSSMASATVLLLALSACGGGGGALAVNSIPPAPPPPPQRAEVVDIFPSPATQEFATIGSGDDLRIRYNATSGLYEVMAGTQDWQALVVDPLYGPTPGVASQTFVFASTTGSNRSYFQTRAHYSSPNPAFKYQYSNLAGWGYEAGTELRGKIAFGMATPSAGVPVTGSATYTGLIEGSSSETYFDGLAGKSLPAFIDGSINLAFNFGSGTLSGSISPNSYLNERRAIASIAFKDTVYSSGSTTFSGKFDTALSGSNAFSGLFTGPTANELIGKFAFPYISPFDGKPAQATGAFIAKQ